MAGLCQANGMRRVALDGKAARSARKDTSRGCPSLVNACAVQNRLFRAQEAVAEGTNEVGTVPGFLKVLDRVLA